MCVHPTRDSHSGPTRGKSRFSSYFNSEISPFLCKLTEKQVSEENELRYEVVRKNPETVLSPTDETRAECGEGAEREGAVSLGPTCDLHEGAKRAVWAEGWCPAPEPCSFSRRRPASLRHPASPLRPAYGHRAAPRAVRPETLGLSPPDASACCSEAAFAANSAASCRSEVTF